MVMASGRESLASLAWSTRVRPYSELALCRVKYEWSVTQPRKGSREQAILEAVTAGQSSQEPRLEAALGIRLHCQWRRTRE